MNQKNTMKCLSAVLVFSVLMISGIAEGATDIPPVSQYNLGDTGMETTFTFEPIEIESLREEDAVNREMGLPMRIGVNRQIPEITFDDGERISDPDFGQIWRFKIRSPEALEMRLHFSSFNLLPDERVYIYGETDAHMEVDYYAAGGPYDSGDFWTWSTPGDDLTIEWQFSLDRRELPFEIIEISHQYFDPYAENNDREGNCHNDATCNVNYRPQRDASAYIQFQDGGMYLCSGTMLNNTNQNFVPYFVTANHCISTETVAQSVQVFFFFHTATCNAGSATKGVRKDGAHLRANTSTTNSSDFSLLELTSTGFDGIYFAGWDRNPMSGGVAITSIHHPEGAYKRISYGSVTSAGNKTWPVRWDRTANPGVTEQGSSGGGLFRDANHLFVGQLYGGTSSCTNQNGLDYYGKFSLSFTTANLQNWLGSATTVNGAYYNSGAPTPTPSPNPTQGAPTHTPSPRPSPTSTPDSGCGTLGCTVKMPAHDYIEGDICYCDVMICNPDESTFMGHNLLVILDVYGQLLFAPSFTSFDYYEVDITETETVVEVIPGFLWPDVAGSASGLTWYAGVLTPEFSSFIGEFGVFTFGWH